MTTTLTPRGTPAAVAAVYEDLEPLLDRLAGDYARRHRDDPDESRSDAAAIFLEAYHTHDPAQSDLRQRVTFLVRRRLRERARKFAKRHAILARTDVDPDTQAGQDEPAGFSWGAFTRRLSPDARTVLALILDGPPELDEAIRTDPHPGPDSIRRHVRALLKSCGWTHPRILEAFADIAGAL